MSHNTTAPTNEQDNQGLYPIRTVSTLTGVNSITLRAWERRYGLIKPVRTAKGHRLYTQNDIDLIQQIMGLLDKGISIGHVHDYLEGPETQTATEKPTDLWTSYQRRMMNAIIRYDVNALDQTYNDALSLYPIDVVTKRLILELLKSLGERWANAESSVAEEHFFGAYLRNKLGARFHHQPARTGGSKLIAACMPGEQHEVGLMLFCLSALNHDYQIVYLGADTPLMELIEPVQRSHADAVLLSSSIDPPLSVLNNDLPKLSAALDIPIFIGGKTAVKFHDDIVKIKAIPLGTDIPQAIKRIDEQLNKA